MFIFGMWGLAFRVARWLVGLLLLAVVLAFRGLGLAALILALLSKYGQAVFAPMVKYALR